MFKFGIGFRNRKSHLDEKKSRIIKIDLLDIKEFFQAEFENYFRNTTLPLKIKVGL